jgi:16S rRNA (cytosine1402-N4)-methyltransferase
MNSSNRNLVQVKQPHRPVLYHEIIYALQLHSGGHYVDGTLGAGGHARGILEGSSPDGLLLGLDLDPKAIEFAKDELKEFGTRVVVIRDSYTNLAHQIRELGWKKVDGIVLDLGVSSMQIDSPQRGFSFQQEGFLDMRFDPELSRSASELVNTLPERELSDLLWQYGEEPRARQIARAICESRPISTTLELASVITRVVHPQPGRIHPATLTFQALRIVVNDELNNIVKVLPLAVGLLKKGGRLAVISFHSLEDRIVKQYFKVESVDCICPPRQPECTCGHKASLKLINRQVIKPGEKEMKENSRARSARLRIIEKI